MTTVSSSTSGTSSYGAKATADTTSLNASFDQFLNLLTTQLKNQDPLSPMDSTEFTNQLVSFSQVEQQIKSNDYLEKLIQSQTLNLTALGLSFIGKDVEVTGETFNTSGGKDVNLGYTMPADATTGTISIVDKDGNVVHTANAELSSGFHSLTWDGKNQNGQAVAAGDYTFKVSALTSNDTSLNVTKYVPGHVESLESLDDGTLVVNVNGKQIGLSDIRKVSESAQ